MWWKEWNTTLRWRVNLVRATGHTWWICYLELFQRSPIKKLWAQIWEDAFCGTVSSSGPWKAQLINHLLSIHISLYTPKCNRNFETKEGRQGFIFENLATSRLLGDFRVDPKCIKPSMPAVFNKSINNKYKNSKRKFIESIFIESLSSFQGLHDISWHSRLLDQSGGLPKSTCLGYVQGLVAG